MIDTLRSNISQDHVSWLPKVDDMQNSYNDLVLKEKSSIESMLASESFDQARVLIENLKDIPDINNTSVHDVLEAELAKHEEAFNRASAKLVADVGIALDAGDVARANALIASADKHHAAPALLARSTWRAHCIEEAASPSSSIAQREAQIALVLAASPSDSPLSADQLDAISRIRASLRQTRSDLAVRIAELQQHADKGALRRCSSRRNSRTSPCWCTAMPTSRSSTSH